MSTGKEEEKENQFEKWKKKFITKSLPVCCFNASPATASTLNLKDKDEEREQEGQGQEQRQAREEEGEGRRGRASVASMYSKNAANIEGTN